jgi:hypothetical protein
MILFIVYTFMLLDRKCWLNLSLIGRPLKEVERYVPQITELYMFICTENLVIKVTAFLHIICIAWMRKRMFVLLGKWKTLVLGVKSYHGTAVNQTP